MRRPFSFIDGIGVGIGSLMLLPLAYFAVARGGFLEMYRELGPSARLPGLTKIVLHPAYGYGAPLVLGIAFGLAIWLRPNRWLIFVVGAASLVTALVTFYGAYLPIWQVAGNIR